MNGNKVMGVYEEQQQTVRLAVRVLFGTVIIGSFLGGSVLARQNSDAPAIASRKLSEVAAMNEKKSLPIRCSVQTASGRISYTEQGTGPVALFVHGVLLNGMHKQCHRPCTLLGDLSGIRRCIAVDLLAH